MSRSPAAGIGLILLATALFVVNGAISRVALRGGVDATTLTSLRVTGAFLVLLVGVALLRPSSLRRPRGRDLLLVVAHGLVGVAALQWTYFVAIDRLPLGLALLLEYQAPILVALWARFVQGESVHRRMWLGLALALLGLGATTEVWNGLAFDSIGILAGYGAAASYAAYFLIGERGLDRMDALQVLTWGFGVATLALNLISPAYDVRSALGTDVSALGRLSSLELPLEAVLVWIIVLGTVVPFALALLALRHLPATVVTSVAMAEPVGATIVGWAWFEESLSPIGILGCITVVAGIAIAQSARRRTPAALPIPA